MSPEELIAKVFGVPLTDVVPSSSPETVEEWDSLAHMNLVLELEETYGIALSSDDALDIKDVASLKRVLNDRGATW